MSIKTIVAGLSLAATSLSTAYAGDAHHDHHDHANHVHEQTRFAPIGLMRDHVHEKGKFMLSYRYEYMNMQGSRVNTDSVSTQEVLNNYMVSPTEMPMQMHMIGGMYGVTEDFTVSVMGMFMDTEMDHLRRNGTSFSTDSSGLGDTKVSGLYEFYNDGQNRVQFNAGISLPTGDVDERNSAGVILPYPMQIGSGTYDLLPGVNYTGYTGDWSWGSQVNATIRLGDNSRGYTLGDRYQLTGWVAKKVHSDFGVSFRLDGQTWDDIEGRDRDLQGPMFMAPTMDNRIQGGERIEALIGADYVPQSGALEGNRIAVEFGMPVYERLDGPRLETDYRFMIGWQKAF